MPDDPDQVPLRDLPFHLTPQRQQILDTFDRLDRLLAERAEAHEGWGYPARAARVRDRQIAVRANRELLEWDWSEDDRAGEAY